MTRSVPRTSPYPDSPVVARLEWDRDLHRLGGTFAGDNWPLTWTDRGDLFTSFNDGFGLSKGVTNYTLGFARISGTPPAVSGADVRTNIDAPVGWGRDGIKASGLLMANGVLYLFVRNVIVGGDWRHARLARSEDGGTTWTWADWHFGGTFGCPGFLQFGRDYAGARDAYIYVLSQDGTDSYAFDPDIVLARVPVGRVPDRAAYEFFAGQDADGLPRWSAEIGERRPIFSDPAGTQRVSMSYNAALGRYFLVTPHALGTDATHTPALGVFDAPEPWGPWTTCYYRDDWANGWMIHHNFPTKWIGEGGSSMWLVFSGQSGTMDYRFVMRRATLSLRR